MSKDRRLGRGLAALLGTPIDEGATGQPGPPGTETTEGMHTSERKADESPSLNREAMVRALNRGTGPSNEVTIPRTATGETLAKPGVGSSEEAATSRSIELPIGEIDNNPFQPRREFDPKELASLAESLKEHEQLQPVLVRPWQGRYQLISGERRLRAAQIAGMPTIRAEIRNADDRMVAELAIVENMQRKDLNPIEKATSFRRYLEQQSCTQEELARRLKLDRSTIANLMRLLELPPSILEAVQKDRLSAGHARALLPLEREDEQIRFAKRSEAEGWSVREMERRVAEHLESSDASTIPGPGSGKKGRRKTKSDLLASLEQEFKLALGTKVEVQQSSSGRGKIALHFSSDEEFERLRSLLTGASGTILKRFAA